MEDGVSELFCLARYKDLFLQGLDEIDESVREESLAKAFLNLGHVLHLIEDVGVPAHARNDFIEAHYRNSISRGNPLESHVEDEIEESGIPARWLESWTPTAKACNKMADYFDTDTRNNNDYLGDGVSPPDTWGLAECTNYQFLSKRMARRILEKIL